MSKLVAKEIRSELKLNFPGVKFSVRSDHNSVSVGYQDGPAYIKVNTLLSKFEAGYFNGMEDIYTYHNDEVAHPRTKYVFVSRSVSEKNREAYVSKYSHIENDYNRETLINKEIQQVSF